MPSEYFPHERKYVLNSFSSNENNSLGKKKITSRFFFGMKVLCLLAGSQLSAVPESTAANALKNEDCVGPEAAAAWSTSPRAFGGQWDGRKSNSFSPDCFIK